jgi:hypothetical protein
MRLANNPRSQPLPNLPHHPDEPAIARPAK